MIEQTTDKEFTEKILKLNRDYNRKTAEHLQIPLDCIKNGCYESAKEFLQIIIDSLNK